MTITFCGHANIVDREVAEAAIKACLEELSKEEKVLFLLGGYGDFDGIALRCCEEYKKRINENATICFVTPYFEEKYLKSRESYLKAYDEIIFPEIEKVPKRYAITYRNRWMIRKCDLLICYIKYDWGGAFETYRYAIKQKRRIVNLAVKKSTDR